MRKSSAFSLVEIIVVISIIGAFAVFSLLSYSSYLESVKIKAAAEQIRSDIIACQNNAQAEHAISIIVFSDTSYTINSLRIVNLPARVFAEHKMFKFASSSNPIPGYFGTLTIKCGAKSKKIIVSPLGRVRIE